MKIRFKNLKEAQDVLYCLEHTNARNGHGEPAFHNGALFIERLQKMIETSSEKVKAFACAAGEFLDEEIELMQEKHGKDLAFFTQGEYRENKGGMHPHEWWAPQEACDEINALIKKDKTS